MFLDLCRPPPSRLSLLPHWFTAAAFLPHYLSLFPFPLSPLSICIYPSLSSSPISQSDSPSRPACKCPYLYTQPLFPPLRSDSCVSVCDAACASGTTASSHLKHFRETHICCFRAQRDMPWQRAVWSGFTGGTRTRARDLRNHKETLAQCYFGKKII